MARTKQEVDKQAIQQARLYLVKFAVGELKMAESKAKELAAQVFILARSNPSIYNASSESIFKCVMLAHKMDLNLFQFPAPEAYLIMRKGELCLDVDYRTILQAIYDGGKISFVSVHVVLQDDDFSVKWNKYGEQEIERGSAMQKDRTNLENWQAVYGVCTLSNGEKILMPVMYADEINKVRNASSSYKNDIKKNTTNSPWIKWYERMIVKTYIKTQAKTLPVGRGRARQLIELDSKEDVGRMKLDAESNDIIDVDPVKTEKQSARKTKANLSKMRKAQEAEIVTLKDKVVKAKGILANAKNEDDWEAKFKKFDPEVRKELKKEIKGFEDDQDEHE